MGPHGGYFLLMRVEFWYKVNTLATHFLCFSGNISCLCCMTFPSGAWRNIYSASTGHWQQTKETIPPKSTLVHWVVYCCYLEEHEPLRGSYTTKSPSQHGWYSWKPHSRSSPTEPLCSFGLESHYFPELSLSLEPWKRTLWLLQLSEPV